MAAQKARHRQHQAEKKEQKERQARQAALAEVAEEVELEAKDVDVSAWRMLLLHPAIEAALARLGYVSSDRKRVQIQQP